MNTPRISAIFSVLIVAAVASAQGLNKEITIEKEIVPEQRAASRLSLFPDVLSPSVPSVTLPFNSSPASVRLPALPSDVYPGLVSPILSRSDFRGYLDAGYFPAYNLSLSAGYRVVDTDDTRVGIYAQFNGVSYKRAPGHSVDKAKFTDNTGLIGVSALHSVNPDSRISADLNFGFSSYNLPGLSGSPSQSTVMVNGITGWESVAGDIDYSVKLRGGYFGYGKATPATRGASRRQQASVGLTGDVSYPLASSSVGIDYAVDYYHYSQSLSWSLDDFTAPLASKGRLLASFTPRYAYSSDNFTARIGARLDISSGAGKAFHIAPDIDLRIAPSSFFSIFVKAGGGEYVNTLRSLWDYNHRIDPSLSIPFSHIPLTIDGGFTVGPWRSLYLTLHGGYAMANDWLMPLIDHTVGTQVMMVPVDMRGATVGATVGFRYRSLVALEADWTMATGDSHDRGYFLWRDYARNVFRGSLTVTPVSPLDIDVAFELRTGRRMYEMNIRREWLPLASVADATSLRAGVKWRFNPQIAAFLRGNNLLNARYNVIDGVPVQGISGLVGVTVLF